MSFTSPEGVQPDAGQGAAPGDTPYSGYLTRFPEEHRATAEQAFKDWDAQTTRKFQEHSEYRRRFEPFEQMGIDQYDPEGLEQLIEFGKLANDPVKFRTWLESAAREHGILQTETQGLDAELLDPAVQQLIEQATSPLQQQLEQMTQWRQQFESQQQQQQIQTQLNQQFDALVQEHGELPREFFESLASGFVGRHPNPMQRAFEEFQRVRGDIEKQVLSAKLNQPNTPNLLGSAPPPGEAPRSLEEAKKLTNQLLAASQQM